MEEKCQYGLDLTSYDPKNYPKICNQRDCPFNKKIKGVQACASTDPDIKQSFSHPPSPCPVMQRELMHRAKLALQLAKKSGSLGESSMRSFR
jgi:hypothetical protein